MVAVTLMFRLLLTQLLLEVLCKSTRFMGVRVIQGCEGMGDIPGIRGGSRGICKFCDSWLDWHKNSDLRSKSTTHTAYSAFHMYMEMHWGKYMFGCICFVPWSSRFHLRSLLSLSLPLREWLKICPPTWQNPSMPAQTGYVQRIGYPRCILKVPFISTIPNWSVNSWFNVSHSRFNSMKRIYTNVYMYDSNLSAKILQFAAHLDRERTCLIGKFDFPTNDYDLVLDIIKTGDELDNESIWAYYYVDHCTSTLFWLHFYECGDTLLGEVSRSHSVVCICVGGCNWTVAHVWWGSK